MLSPELIGWVVLALRLDPAEMKALVMVYLLGLSGLAMVGWGSWAQAGGAPS